MPGLSLEELNRRIRQCKKCRLWKEAENAVPGEGPEDAQVMLVGQNPGKEEDRTGRPFVGRSGKFLNRTLDKNDIRRGNLFITNIVKHKTPENRKPRSDEVEACIPFLREQIETINPEIIVLMGTVAWQTPREEEIKYVETYHPSAAMRFPNIRKKFKKDFETLGELWKDKLGQ